MSALGQKPTSTRSIGMSAQCQQTTKMHPAHRNLFDHLVGAGEESWRHGEPENASGAGVDHKLELACLHHRHVGRFGTLKDATAMEADLPIGIIDVAAVANQPTGLGIFPSGIDC